MKIATVIGLNDLPRNMQCRNAFVFLTLVCIAVIMAAGCTGSTANNTPHGDAGMAPATTQVVTPGLATPVLSPAQPAPSSQDPIIGKWSITFAKGGSAQVVFSADGSFAGYLNGGNQVFKSGTWQSTGNGKYTVTITGQASPANWVLDANTTAYDSTYPALVYSRAG